MDKQPSRKVDPIIEAVIAMVLAPPTPNREPHPCDEEGCENKAECYEACPECGWHPPYCGCV